jgi:hypothetical protein
MSLPERPENVRTYVHNGKTETIRMPGDTPNSWERYQVLYRVLRFGIFSRLVEKSAKKP